MNTPPSVLRLENDRRLVMIALALLLVPLLWYIRTDLQLFASNPPRLQVRLLVRGSMVAILVGGFALIGSAWDREKYTRRLPVLAWCVALGLLALNALRPSGATMPLRSPMFCLMVLYGAMPNRFWRQVAPPVALSAGLIALRLTWLTAVSDSDAAGDVLILIVLNVTGVLVVLQRLAIEREVYQAWMAEHDARILTDRALADLRALRAATPASINVPAPSALAIPAPAPVLSGVGSKPPTGIP